MLVWTDWSPVRWPLKTMWPCDLQENLHVLPPFFFMIVFHFISVRFWKKSDFGPVYLRQTPVRNLKHFLSFHRSIVSIFFVVFFIFWTKFCGRIWINIELAGILVNSDALFSLQWKLFVVKRPASGHFIYLFWLLFSQLSTCIWLYYYKRDGSLWQALTLDLQNARFSARGKIWGESGWGLPGIWH